MTAAERVFREHADVARDAVEDPALVNDVAHAAVVVARALRAGRKVLCAGNGGSASDAQHLVAELVGRFGSSRRDPLRAVTLGVDPALVTAIGNDFGFEHVFRRQVQALADDGDVVILFSTSGESPNVVEAADAARRRGSTVIAVSAGDGGRLAELSDVCLLVPTTDVQRAQELHAVALHALVAEVEALLLDDGEGVPTRTREAARRP